MPWVAQAETCCPTRCMLLPLPLLISKPTPGSPCAPWPLANRHFAKTLAHNSKTLSQSLQTLHRTASAEGPGALPSVPPELLEYVENGRNPDIYTREFVELVRRGNQLMRGKTRAFGLFRDILAEQMRCAMPELRDDVDRVLEATGGRRGNANTTTATTTTTTDDGNNGSTGLAVGPGSAEGPRGRDTAASAPERADEATASAPLLPPPRPPPTTMTTTTTTTTTTEES